MDKLDKEKEVLETGLSSAEFIVKFCKSRDWFRDKKEDDKVLDALAEILRKEVPAKKPRKKRASKKPVKTK